MHHSNQQPASTVPRLTIFTRVACVNKNLSEAMACRKHNSPRADGGAVTSSAAEKVNGSCVRTI